jgi:predicted DNA-binding transcriptional regulator YafY
LKIQLGTPLQNAAREFDIGAWRGRRWLAEAMQDWIRDAPVTVRVTRTQAERLKQDWYYRYAEFRETEKGNVEMTFGADRREFVFELVRWLGMGAELLEPRAWRDALGQELQEMAGVYG